MADKFTLSKVQLQELVFDNDFPINSKTQFIARCIDGRYRNSDELPALAVSGADAGELAMIYAASNIYGFKVDEQKAFNTLVEVVGGIKNFRMHTDEHGDTQIAAGGCGHMTQIRLDPKAYNLEVDQVEILDKQLVSAKKAGALEVKLEDAHKESAVVMVIGDHSILPQYNLETDNGVIFTEVFIHHKTLVDARHKVLADKLVANGAVTLFDNLDAEYLYEVISQTSDDHLFETTVRLAKTLPMYAVKFKDNGEFEIEDRGYV